MAVNWTKAFVGLPWGPAMDRRTVEQPETMVSREAALLMVSDLGSPMSQLPLTSSTRRKPSVKLMEAKLSAMPRPGCQIKSSVLKWGQQ